jgi:peptide methionine sulfoxide reductase MsrA
MQKKWNHPIDAQIKKSQDFFRAEEHHQHYFMKNKIDLRS